MTNTEEAVARKIAKKQLDELNRTGEFDESKSHFEFNGVCIVNPWVDPTGRFPLSKEEAVSTYGEENIKLFIKSCTDSVK